MQLWELAILHAFPTFNLLHQIPVTPSHQNQLHCLVRVSSTNSNITFAGRPDIPAFNVLFRISPVSSEKKGTISLNLFVVLVGGSINHNCKQFGAFDLRSMISRTIIWMNSFWISDDKYLALRGVFFARSAVSGCVTSMQPNAFSRERKLRAISCCRCPTWVQHSAAFYL